jgi:hypothetical protein
MEFKKCHKCQAEKPATSEYFYTRPNGNLSSPCKECSRRAQDDYTDRHRQKIQERRKAKRQTLAQNQKDYRQRTLEAQRRRMRERRSNLRMLALWRYGGQPPACRCCGEDAIRFLCVHGPRKLTTRLYGWLKENGYPSGYHVLCYNCSFSWRIYNRCPHQGIGDPFDPHTADDPRQFTEIVGTPSTFGLKGAALDGRSLKVKDHR